MLVTIGEHLVGQGHPTFIIAEAGVNHNGDLAMAKRLIDVAADAGANAVKFQTFKAANLVTRNARKAAYQSQQTAPEESQYDMLKRLELLPEMHETLQGYCAEKGIIFLSTPFDETSADLLEALDIPAFKIPSGEITNHPFLRYVAAKGRPMIVSTGMSTLGEVEAALQVIQAADNQNVILLHCVSNYPAAPQDVNLSAMQTMRAAFGVPIGYSDHTTGIAIALAAVAMGARVIEKHFTLDRTLPGPDHSASLEPDELNAMVRGIREIETALGDGRKVPTASEADTREVARKSLVAARDIPAHTILSEDDIAIKRPGTGIPPAHSPYIIGRTTRRAISADSLIRLEDLQ